MADTTLKSVYVFTGFKGAGIAQEFSSPESTFCADSYFGICSTPVLPQ